MGWWGAGGDKDEQEGLRQPTQPTAGLDHPSHGCFKFCRLLSVLYKSLSTRRAGCLWSVPPKGDAHWGMSQGELGLNPRIWR